MTSYARHAARAAVIHGLPAVDLHRHLVSSALDRLSPEYRAPVNQLAAAGRPSAASAPHAWYAWLDLRSEPVVLTVPSAEGCGPEVEVVDLYGGRVGVERPPAGAGGPVVVRGPRGKWAAATPSALAECPTELGLLLVAWPPPEGGDAGPRSRPGQPELRPLSLWLGRPVPAPLAPAVPDLAVVDVRAPLDERFLRVLAVMLPLMPARDGEEHLRMELSLIGVGGAPAEGGSPAASADLQAGLAEGIGEVRRRSAALAPRAGAPARHAELHADDLSRAAASYLRMNEPERHLELLASAGP